MSVHRGIILGGHNPEWRQIAYGQGWKYGDNPNIVMTTSRGEPAGWRVWTDDVSDPFFADLDEAKRYVENLPQTLDTERR